MNGNVIETVLGAVVLVVAALFLFFVYSTSELHTVKGYEVTANFSSIAGIEPGGDVRISGIKVGSILSTSLDPKTYLATVRMSIARKFKLPDDTVAEIVSASLLGSNFMSLVPGGSEKDIPPGGRIKYTQAPVSLANLIGQTIFSQPGGEKKPGPAAPDSPAPKAPAPASPGGAPAAAAK